MSDSKLKTGMSLKEEIELSRLRDKERRRSSMDRDEFRERVYYFRRSRSRSYSPGRRSRDRYYRDFNSRSRSRSKSPRSREILRDRSLSNDRSYSRDRYIRNYSRSPERRGSREREKPSSSGGGDEIPRKFFSPQYLVHSKDPELMANRLFIGNLPTDRLTEKEVEEIFNQYGKVLGVALFRGYGFVQMDSQEAAHKAVAVENGSLLKSNKIDVKMAHEGRFFKKDPPADGKFAADHYRGPRPPFPSGFRPPHPEFFRGMHPGDPFRDPYRPPLPAADPYFRDSYRRDDPYYRGPPRDPWGLRVIDPLRDPYLDPFRDWLAPSAGKERPPVDLEIILTNPKLRDYANIIERRLAGLLMLSYINLLAPEVSMTRAIENVSRHKVPYAIILNEQNETHRSLTLNILHGIPQEHRNMPFDDAMSLLAINFDQYVRDQKEKATSISQSAPAAAASASAAPSFKLPDHHMHYLLNLLADKRYLSLDEIDQVLKYLHERRNELVVQQGGSVAEVEKKPMASMVAAVESYVTGNDVHSMSSNNQSMSYGAISNQHHHQQLQHEQPQHEQLQSEVPNSSPQSIRALASSLDNPAVQAALNNLLASGPSLLQSLSAVSSQSQKAPAASSSSGLASLSMAYDRASPPHADVHAASLTRPSLHQSTGNGPRAGGPAQVRGPGPVRAPMSGAPRPGGGGLRPSQPHTQGAPSMRPQQQQQRPTQHIAPTRLAGARASNARPSMW